MYGSTRGGGGILRLNQGSATSVLNLFELGRKRTPIKYNLAVVATASCISHRRGSTVHSPGVVDLDLPGAAGLVNCDDRVRVLAVECVHEFALERSTL